MTLPITVASDAVVSEQCLTATLTGNPPPGNGRLDDAISNNVAKVCLGPVLLTKGLSDLVTLSPCVGETAYPCDASDTLELVVNGAVGDRIRYGTLQPKGVVVQIEDPAGRVVSGGNTLWRTGNAKDYSPTGLDILPGLAASLVIPVVADGYRQHTFAIADATPGAGSNPGSVKWRLASNDFTLLHTISQLSFSHAGLTTPRYDTVFEFSALGTYLVNLTLGAEHSSTSYSDTETYTFHVGPITDLEVQAALATGAMTAGNQIAFTVTATYHGPENSTPGVQVQVTLPSGMQFVSADSDDFVQDNNNPQTGVWNIGELKVKGFRHSLRQPESERLTIVAELTGDVSEPVTGSIKNHQDYCVRIKTGGTPSDDLECDGSAVPTGYTEHSGPYYDYQPDNNEFSLNPDWKAVAAKNPPYLTGVSITSTPTFNVIGPSAYLLGDVIEVSADFSKVVYVTGSPTLRLQIGDEEREAEFYDGSGTQTLRFEYTVGQWDRDDDGVSIPANPINASGHPIRDGDGNDAMLDYAGLGNQDGHQVGGPGTPATPPEPQAAGRLTATARDGAVDLEWPAGSDGDKVFWELWRNDDPTWWEIMPRSMGSRLGYTVTGLENGTEYMFRVRAHYKYEHGDTPGPASDPVAATPTAPPAPPPGQTPPPGQPAGPNTPPEFDRDTAWADYCVNGGTGSGVEVARVTAFDQDGDRLTFYQVKGFDEIGDQHFTVSNVTIGDTYWAVIRTSRSIPRNLEPADGFIGIDLEVNDGRGGLDQIGVSLRYDASGGNCQDTGSRSTEAEESGPSVLAAVRTWAGSVRNWWAEFANRTFTGLTFLSWRDAWFAAHPGAVPPSSR